MDRLRSISYRETDTKAPYIVKDIKNPPTHNEVSLQIGRRLDDTSRLAQMLVDRPGLTYLAKEGLLKVVQGDNVVQTAGYLARIAGSTLAQVPVSGTGLHFVRGFGQDYYIKEGAPLARVGAKIIADNRGEEGYNDLYQSNLKEKKTVDRPEEDPERVDNRELAKQGKPINVAGNITVPASFGPVTIPSAKNTTPIPETLGISNKEVQGDHDGSTSTLGSGQLIQDFRKDSGNTYSFDYGDTLINKETRVGLGDQGRVQRNRTSYAIQDPLTRDKINYLDVSREPLNGIEENRDLIQLEFQVVTPDDTYYLAFRAFLENFDDNFQGSWSSTKYLGRADNFYTYEGFERNIQIGFKIAAATREEMKPLYRKAATLASVTAPTYGQGGRFMRGSIAKVTVGDYIYEQPGIIDSVSYTWQKAYPWEISFQNPEGKDNVQILPHVLDVSVNFKVIHDFLPQTGITPLITNHRPISANKQTYIDLEKPEVVKGVLQKEAQVAQAAEQSTPASSPLPPPVSSDLQGAPSPFSFIDN